jgi:hypothetical protein
MKALLRELVTSATYHQQARSTPSLLEKDPRNRLLAHGPQQRLTAEMVRDQALLASGLFNGALGGPPVMPPQPAGLWMNISNSAKWTDATGPDRYRRAIYTYEKRSTPYPSYVMFDGPDHVVSLVRRIPTNTPLQALVTLNDPVYQEAAQALARRMLAVRGTAAGGGTTSVASFPTGITHTSDTELLERRLNFAARSVLSRDLSPRERAALESFYADARKLVYADAKKRAFGSGSRGGSKNGSRAPSTASNSELLALTAVASTLLNLDAALNR